MNSKKRLPLYIVRVVLSIIAVTALMLLSSCLNEGNSGASGSVEITLKNGSFLNGAREAKIKDGKSYTVIAEERIGFYFDGWLKNGTPCDLEESFMAVANSSDSNKIVYEAVYRMSDGAEFEDVKPGNLFDDFTSGRFEIGLDLNSTNITAEVMKEPFDDRNQVLCFVDDDFNKGGAVRIDIASVPGNFLVYSLDFYLDSYSGNVPVSIKLGNYTVDFYAFDRTFRICDSDGYNSASLKYEFDPFDWHNLKVMVSGGSVNGKGAHSFVFVDGECVAESSNVGGGSYSNTIAFTTTEQSKAVVYLDNVIAYRQDVSLADEVAFDPDVVIKSGNITQDAYYQAELFLSEGALAALKEMDEQLFSENIYRWIAELYDPETSAIYFSISGRDNYGYLPDIETTSQASGVLSTLGIGSLASLYSAEQKANLLAWVMTLQSNRDGYNYHPHWGVSIGSGRLSRDYSYAGTSYSTAGAGSYRLFNDANYRLSGGNSGIAGYTQPSTYDNSLVGRLTASDVSAVSKVVLASENSSMPVHLRSEENLVKHINNYWNNTCSVSGVHERHFCTDKCVIVEDPSDSYMKIVEGKLVITRGYRCTSCHVCKHSTGHSYSFGHTFTSMGGQIKAAGLGDATVMYFYDIQENVQASLRDKAQAKYIEENGENKWNSLDSEEKAAIREAAENGIWEEEITYNTISGLLKICGIPGAHGYEFLYAAKAIDSAIKGALFSVDDYVNRREAIVSIYNPFNAINGIMNNINNYGKDPSVRTEAMAVIRSQAEALIRNTSEKLSYYLMPDGGYSYSMSGYCTNSQGQPVAVNGWNNGVGEGDVNGTALALGTRGALVSCLGFSVGAPFGGSRSLYSEDGYDLDCNGVIEGDELRASHTDVFKSIITHKAPIQKVDVTATDSTYDFEGDDPLMPSSGTVVSDGNNKVVEVVDDKSNSGLYTSFLPNHILGTEAKTVIKLDMKFIQSNNTTSHQIFGGSSNSLYVNMSYRNGEVSFDNKYGESKYQTLCDAQTGEKIEVNAREWFTLEITVYVDGKIIDGEKCYGTFAVTQNGVTKTARLKGLNAYKAINGFNMYSLNGAVNKVHYDNVSCSSVVIPGVYDGEYHFDNTIQKVSDKLTTSPTNEKDTVYELLGGETASFRPDRYSTGSVIYNFDFFHGAINLSDAVAGDKVDFVFADSSGRTITGINLVINEDKTVTFYAANGQKLQLFGKDGDMTLSHDMKEWLEIKLEYHYDIGQFDVVIKYADLNNQSFKKTVAASLVGVELYETAANALEFTEFNIRHESESESKIYLDDMYIRNVFVP